MLITKRRLFTLIFVNNEPTCQKRAGLSRSLSHLRLDRGSDGLFMFSGSTVVIRPRSHWGRFWKLDQSEIGLARIFFSLKWILEPPRTRQYEVKLAGDFIISHSDLLLIDDFHVTSSPPCWWTVNKRLLISSFCLSTSICSFHHCYLCLPRLHENHLLMKPKARSGQIRFCTRVCLSGMWQAMKERMLEIYNPQFLTC